MQKCFISYVFSYSLFFDEFLVFLPENSCFVSFFVAFGKNNPPFRGLVGLQAEDGSGRVGRGDVGCGNPTVENHEGVHIPLEPCSDRGSVDVGTDVYRRLVVEKCHWRIRVGCGKNAVEVDTPLSSGEVGGESDHAPCGESGVIQSVGHLVAISSDGVVGEGVEGQLRLMEAHPIGIRRGADVGCSVAAP